MLEGVGIIGSFEEVESVKCEEGNNIHETDLAHKTTARLGAIISLKHRVAHFLIYIWGHFTPTLEDWS